MNTLTATTSLTVEDVFGIACIETLIEEQANLTGYPDTIDELLAETDYRDTLSAYLPHGWDITPDDQIIRVLDDADPLNITETRLNAIPAMQYFEIADYVIDDMADYLAGDL